MGHFLIVLTKRGAHRWPMAHDDHGPWLIINDAFLEKYISQETHHWWYDSSNHHMNRHDSHQASNQACLYRNSKIYGLTVYVWKDPKDPFKNFKLGLIVSKSLWPLSTLSLTVWSAPTQCCRQYYCNILRYWNLFTVFYCSLCRTAIHIAIEQSLAILLQYVTILQSNHRF